MQHNTTLPVYGVRQINFVNWRGIATLYAKEVRRYLKVYTQTLAAPAVTTLLNMAIFVVALGGVQAGKTTRVVLGVPFADFIAPGLIIMAMMQNAFANTSSTLIIGKVQGSIIDVLMPPLLPGELVAAFVAGAVTRALMVSVVVWLVVWFVPGVNIPVRHFWAVAYFGLMGSTLLALIGILTGIWAEKFDHTAAVTNFVVQPLSMLSGTFYTISRLPESWKTVSLYNPFFHIIDGFRYGFIGASDAHLLPGALSVLGLNVLLWTVCVQLFKSGWRLRA